MVHVYINNLLPDFIKTFNHTHTCTNTDTHTVRRQVEKGRGTGQSVICRKTKREKKIRVGDTQRQSDWMQRRREVGRL